MEKQINILHLEDNDFDADLIGSSLKSYFPYCAIFRVSTEKNFEMMLKTHSFDLIISDFQVVSYSGLNAMEYSKKNYPDIPFIFVSGSIDVDTAVKCLQKGAIDYLPKDHLKRLGFVVNRALIESEEKEKLKKSEELLFDLNKKLKDNVDERTKELRLAKENLSQLIESVPIVFFTARISDDFGATYVSSSVKEITGFTPEEFTGNSSFWASRIHPDDKDKVLKSFEKLFTAGSNYVEYRWQIQNGNYLWFSDRTKIVNDENNQPLYIAGTWKDITERKIAEEKIEETNEQLKKLSRRLLEIQEDERRYISQELHDEIGQSLTAIKLNLMVLNNLPANKESKKLINSNIEIVESAIENVRRISLDLRPSILDDLGLISAVKWYINRQADRTGINFSFNVSFESRRFAVELETACFRIVQEAITNSIKYSNTKSIIVDLFIDNDFLCLSIKDDGDGFDFKQAWHNIKSGKSLGLLSMKERAEFAKGELWIESEIGKGTNVKANFRI